MPWTARKARSTNLRLLARTQQGWLVKNFNYPAHRLWRVAGGERTELSENWVSEGDYYGYRVAADRSSYAVLHLDDTQSDEPSDELVVAIKNLDGQPIGTRGFSYGWVLDFSGSDVVVRQHGGTGQRWHVASDQVTDLEMPTVAADLGHDLAFVVAETGQVGPTSLDTPGAPAWTASMTGIAISPGGRRIVSQPENARALEVRDVATGEVLVSYRVSAYDEDVLWDTDHTFLVAAIVGLNNEALIRCNLSGRCVRVSDKVTQGSISLPQ
jgi:hypothetical protein